MTNGPKSGDDSIANDAKSGENTSTTFTNDYNFDQKLQDFNNFYNQPVNQWPAPQPVLTTTSTIYITPYRGPLSKNPECRITVNKSRLKEFGSHVYMADESEFEIEMFNPSTETLGARIKINGQYISESIFVLYPGQRMLLDRFLDDANKFKFKTYTVSNTKEAKEAIVDNGNVQVEFYRETVPQPIQSWPQQGKPYWYNGDPNNIKYDNYQCNDYKTNMFYCSSADIGNVNNCLNFSDSVNINTAGTVTNMNADGHTLTKSSNREIETGRVMKGGKSETEFSTVDMEFESIYTYSKSFKIMPISQKPIVAKDLIRHCTNCGIKQKKEWKFCSGCGTKN